MLQLKVGNIFTDIEGYISQEQFELLQRALSFRPKGYEFSTLYNRWITKNGKRVRRMWDGWRKQIWKRRGSGGSYFPTGLLSDARKSLKKNQVEFTLVDCRKRPDATANLSLSKSLTVRDYQREVIDNACKGERGVIQIATGGGKTVCAAGIISKLNVAPFIFFVTSRDLLTQAKESLEENLCQNGQPIQIGQVGGGIIDIKDVNVMTVQTAVRAVGEKWDSKHKFDSDDSDDKTPIEQRRADILAVLKSAKGIICDEVQHWRADTCQLVARALDNAYYTYGLSATPYRDDGDDLMINACFGKKITEISASELIRKNWLVRPSIKIVHIKSETSKFRQWQQLYKDQVSENDKYNKIVSVITNTYVRNGRFVLVLVQQLKHGKTLAAMIPGSVYLSGNSPKKKREQSLNQLRNKEISCIVSTVIFDEGIDVSSLDTVILAGQGKSRVRAMQRIGRILRIAPGKTKATAIDFRIHQKYLLDHSKEREKMYRTEEEYEIEEIDPGVI